MSEACITSTKRALLTFTKARCFTWHSSPQITCPKNRGWCVSKHVLLLLDPTHILGRWFTFVIRASMRRNICLGTPAHTRTYAARRSALNDAVVVFQALAVDISLAALLGENIYNFGELLLHPIVSTAHWACNSSQAYQCPCCCLHRWLQYVIIPLCNTSIVTSPAYVHENNYVTLTPEDIMSFPV